MNSEDKNKPNKSSEMSRRKFFNLIGWPRYGEAVTTRKIKSEDLITNFSYWIYKCYKYMK